MRSDVAAHHAPAGRPAQGGGAQGSAAPAARSARGRSVAEELQVLLAQPRRRLVVEEGQEGVAPAAVTCDTAWSREQENTTAPPGGGLEARAGPYSGKPTSPPSNSALRLIETAKRRCAVPLVVLSRWARKWPPSSARVAGDDVALHARRRRTDGPSRSRARCAGWTRSWSTADQRPRPRRCSRARRLWPWSWMQRRSCRRPRA